jgi:hypothetical protein
LAATDLHWNIDRAMKIRAERDFWAGIMFLAFAAVGMFASRGYSMGTAGRMGPGYFPVLLALVLALLAIILIVRSFLIDGEPLTQSRLGPLAIIVAGVCFFGATIEQFGLVVAIALVSIISTFAARESSLKEVAAIAAALIVFSVGVFVYALRLPLIVWPAF